MPKGTITNTGLDKKSFTDISLAEETCTQLGIEDKGQACIVSNGKVIALEDINGTDYMLFRSFKDSKDQLKGGLLMKTLKPIQDPRVDLPTVGIDTLKPVSYTHLTLPTNREV